MVYGTKEDERERRCLEEITKERKETKVGRNSWNIHERTNKDPSQLYKYIAAPTFERQKFCYGFPPYPSNAARRRLSDSGSQGAPPDQSTCTETRSSRNEAEERRDSGTHRSNVDVSMATCPESLPVLSSYQLTTIVGWSHEMNPTE